MARARNHGPPPWQPSGRHWSARLTRAGCDLSRLAPTKDNGGFAPPWLRRTKARFSGRERRPAAASRGCVRVLDHKLGALQSFGVVDFRADEVLIAHWIDQQRHSVLFHRRIVFIDGLVEGEAVLESRATSTAH